MKKIFYILLISGAIASIAGCKKNSGDSGCITLSNVDLDVNAADSAKDAQLFKQNNIFRDNLEFIDTLISGISVTALQKANGLLIFNSYAVFFFKNNVYTSTSGQLYNPTVNQSTVPKLTLSELRQLFIATAAKDNTYKNVDFSGSCLNAQFGYYDIGAGQIVPAWFVRLQVGSSPSAYIRDDNGTMIRFPG